MRARKLQDGLAILVGLVLALLLAELSLRAAMPRVRFLRLSDEAFWLAQLEQARPSRDNGVDTVPDPELGWRMKPNHTVAGVRHNSQGFRGAKEYVRTAGAPRILAIGDSFTYGLGMVDGDTYPAQLERLTGVEVINAGVNAYGLDQAVLLWERHGPALRPQVVVLGYFVDDFERSGMAIREAPKPYFAYNESPPGYALLPPAAAHRLALERDRQALWSKLQVVLAARWVWRKLERRFGAVDESRLLPKARLSRYLLERLKLSVGAAGAALVVLVIGERHGDPGAARWIEQSIMRSCSELALVCINAAASMREAGLERMYGANGHLSAEGNRFAAELVVAALPPTLRGQSR